MNKIEGIMITLAIFSISLLLIDFLYPLSYEMHKLISYIDLGIVSIFWIEFVYAFRKANWKLQFIKQRWADIIGMIPLTELSLRVFRLFRIIRVVRASKILRLAEIFKKIEKMIKSVRRLFKKLSNISIY